MLTPLKAYCTAQAGEWALDKTMQNTALTKLSKLQFSVQGGKHRSRAWSQVFEDGKQSNGYVLIKEDSLKGFIQQQVAKHDEITALEAFLPSFQSKHKL